MKKDKNALKNAAKDQTAPKVRLMEDLGLKRKRADSRPDRTGRQLPDHQQRVFRTRCMLAMKAGTGVLLCQVLLNGKLQIVQYITPLTWLRLAQQAYAGVPRAIVAFDHPAPIWAKGQ